MRLTEFSLDLLNFYERPIVQLYGLNALIDTGAMVPVFSLPVSVLVRTFGATLSLDGAEVGGFGGKCRGRVYSLKDFRVGVLLFETLEAFVPDVPVTKHPFLLSASMFYGTAYTFDTVNFRFSVRIPDGMSRSRKFVLKDLRGRLYAQIDGVLLQSQVDSEGIIDNFAEFFFANSAENLFSAEN